MLPEDIVAKFRTTAVARIETIEHAWTTVLSNLAEDAALTIQRELTLLFYDEALEHRLTKLVPVLGGVRTGVVLRHADAMLKRIRPERFDFDRAKASILGQTHL